MKTSMLTIVFVAALVACDQLSAATSQYASSQSTTLVQRRHSVQSRRPATEAGLKSPVSLRVRFEAGIRCRC